MSTYLIHSYEKIFKGLFDLEYIGFLETEIPNEPEQVAKSSSLNIITFNLFISELLEDRIKKECNKYKVKYNNNNPAEQEIRDRIFTDDIEYKIIKLDLNKLPTKNVY